MENESQGMRTSLYSILCIVIRLGAVMLAFDSVARTFAFFGFGRSVDSSIGESLMVVAFLLLCLLISFLFWFYPGPLARLASGRSAHQVLESSIEARQIQWVAFSVLGMYWVMTGLLDLANIGYQFFWLAEMLGTGEEAARRLHGQVAYHVLEIVLGLALTLGASGLANLLHRARYAGSSGMAARNQPKTSQSD